MKSAAVKSVAVETHNTPKMSAATPRRSSRLAIKYRELQEAHSAKHNLENARCWLDYWQSCYSALSAKPDADPYRLAKQKDKVEYYTNLIAEREESLRIATDSLEALRAPKPAADQMLRSFLSGMKVFNAVPIEPQPVN